VGAALLLVAPVQANFGLEVLLTISQVWYVDFIDCSLPLPLPG
jgi:hypothetical protein